MVTNLISKMPAEAKPEDELHTCNIMTYELGAVVNSLVWAKHKRSWGDTKGANARRESARVDLADLITQCRLLAEQMYWSWFELERDGQERFLERMKEIEENSEDGTTRTRRRKTS